MICDSKSYGDGHAAERIVQAIRHHFNLDTQRPKDFQSPKPDKVTEDNRVFIKPITSKVAHSNADAL
jgi:hypothetical protein